MRLALVACCLLAVVAVSISPSSGNPAPCIKECIKAIEKKIVEIIDRIKGVWRGRRDVDFKNHKTYESDLRALSDLVSALEDAPDVILSSVEDVYNNLERGSFEDDVSDIEDSDEDDKSAEDVDKSADDSDADDKSAEDIDKSAADSDDGDKSAENVDKSAEDRDDDDMSAEDEDKSAEDARNSDK